MESRRDTSAEIYLDEPRDYTRAATTGHPRGTRIKSSRINEVEGYNEVEL